MKPVFLRSYNLNATVKKDLVRDEKANVIQAKCDSILTCNFVCNWCIRVKYS